MMKKFPSRENPVLEKHTIFALDQMKSPHRLQTSVQSKNHRNSSEKIFRKTVYYPKGQQNSWIYPIELLSRKHKINQIKSPSIKKKPRYELIKQIQSQIPDMKSQSLMNSRNIQQSPNISKKVSPKIDNKAFERFRQIQRKKQRQRLSQKKQKRIRKISVLSINSTKSLNQIPSPQLAYNKKTPNNFQNNQIRKRNPSPILNSKPNVRQKQKRDSKNFYLPVTVQQNSNQDMDNSHYNNQKYYNERRVVTEANNQYENQINRLRKELERSESIITNLRFRELENQINKLKENDKKYDQLIEKLYREIQEEKLKAEKEKQEKQKISKQLQQERLENQKRKRPQTNLEKRSKTQGNTEPIRKSSSSLSKKQEQKPVQQNFHVIADHSKQIQHQKQFLLITPKKTRQKLQNCYSQLKKLPIPEIQINPFRVPRIPNPPKHEQYVEDYLKLAKELCKCLSFNVEEIDIVIKRYRNCISFKVQGDQGNIVIWNFDGKLYTGGWKQEGDRGEGKKQGIGMEFTQEYCFKGEYVDGKRNGKGTMQYYNGNVFEGEWKNGKIEGKGIYFDKSNYTYFQGQWDRGQQRGRGIIKYTKKHYYTGQFKNMIKSGKGTQFYQNGDIYQGSYDKGLGNGSGIYYYHTGQFYVGNFLNSKRHGTGLFLTNKFQGDLVEKPQKDLKQNQVQKQKQRIEQYYYGQFSKGSRSGYGILRKADNTYYFGYFYNDIPHGPGILQNMPYFQKKTHNRNAKNLVKITGIWKQGQIIVTNKNIPSQKGSSKQFSENN